MGRFNCTMNNTYFVLTIITTLIGCMLVCDAMHAFSHSNFAALATLTNMTCNSTIFYVGPTVTNCAQIKATCTDLALRFYLPEESFLPVFKSHFAQAALLAGAMWLLATLPGSAGFMANPTSEAKLPVICGTVYEFFYVEGAALLSLPFIGQTVNIDKGGCLASNVAGLSTLDLSAQSLGATIFLYCALTVCPLSLVLMVISTCFGTRLSSSSKKVVLAIETALLTALFVSGAVYILILSVFSVDMGVDKYFQPLVVIFCLSNLVRCSVGYLAISNSSSGSPEKPEDRSVVEPEPQPQSQMTRARLQAFATTEDKEEKAAGLINEDN